MTKERSGRWKEGRKPSQKINFKKTKPCERTESWRDVVNAPLSFQEGPHSWTIYIVRSCRHLPNSAPVARTLLLFLVRALLVASGLELEHLRYSLWGAKRDRAGRAGILHDWSSAAELSTRSDKSFSFRVLSIFTGTYTTYTHTDIHTSITLGGMARALLFCSCLHASR